MAGNSWQKPLRPKQGAATPLTRFPMHALLLHLLALSCLMLMARPAQAHPMGNFSISHYAAIRIEPGFLELRYMLDMAEIPTFQEMQRTGIVAKVDDPRVATYLAQQAEALEQGLVLELDGRRLVLHLVSHDILFPPGAGNLPTMKLGFVYRAPFAQLAGGTESLDYQDLNFSERAGWKEVIARSGQGIAIASSTVPQTDRSSQLSNYPTDLINSPPQVLEARVTFQESGLTGTLATGGGKQRAETSQADSKGLRQPAIRVSSPKAERSQLGSGGTKQREEGGPHRAVPGAATSELALRPNRQGTPRNAFTDLVASTHFGLWFLLMAAAIAAGLGALHALEPGHGKTIVAAYLVGSRGTASHACLLGLIVTASHTAGVYLLGAITLYASRYVVPDRLYPWLGVISGLTIAGVGFYLFLLRRRGNGHGHSHSHAHPHAHPHVHGHAHPHVHDHEAKAPAQAEGLKLLRIPIPESRTPAAENPESRTPAFASPEPHAHQPHHDHAHEHHHGHIHPKHSRQHFWHRLFWHSGHSGHSHSHSHSHSHVPSSGSVSYRELLALGITGGMIPCPAALVVLLSAVTLHRIGFGLFLIVAFSAGLAAVLIGIGLLTVCAGRFMQRFRMEGPLIRRWLPMASAGVITLLGLGIASKALIAAGLL